MKMSDTNTGLSARAQQIQGSSDGISVLENIHACAQNAELADRENTFLEPGPIRASLYRGKRRRVNLNPSRPLSNPFRVSEHDQMPVRVIPISPFIESPLKRKRRRSIRRSNFVSSSIVYGSKRIKNGSRKLPANSPPSCPIVIQTRQPLCDELSNQNASFKTPTPKPKLVSLTDKDVLLTPQSRARSMDSLLNKPHYMTRNALKRVNEQELTVLDETCLSVSSNEGNVSQSSPNLSRNPFRSSKSRKTGHKFNFAIFSKSSKAKSASEFSLHQATSFENLDPLDKEQNATINTDFTTEKKGLRKRRLSGFRAKFQKKCSPEKVNCDVTDGGSEPKRRRKSLNKRTSQLFRRARRDEGEANNNIINDENLSLQTVLANKELSEEFRSFLAREHSDENFDFWMICEKYKRASNRANLAEVIRRQFLRDGAPREVNLDAETKSKINANTRILGKESFVEAQESIFRLMEEDPFRRFSSLRRSKNRKEN